METAWVLRESLVTVREFVRESCLKISGLLCMSVIEEADLILKDARFIVGRIVWTGPGLISNHLSHLK